MNELLTATLPWLPVTMAPVALTLLAPTVGPKSRTAIASLLGLGAVIAVGLALAHGAEPRELEIINPFFNPNEGQPIPFVVEKVNTPGWVWPVVGAGILLLPALLTWLLREKAAKPPCPVTYSLIISVWVIAARLALEKAAAPEPLTWAIGVTAATMLLLPFIGWWSGAQGFSFKKLLVVLLLVGVGQRAMIVGVGFLATTMHLGTHLDVTAIREVTLLVGHHDFTGPGDQSLAQWWSLILIPQFMLWIPITVVAGLVVGLPPYLLARRCSTSPPV